MFELATRRSRGLLVAALITACTAVIMLGQMSAYAAPAQLASPTPHPAEGRENCLSCHPVGGGSALASPADHSGRANETCLMCHQLQGAAPAAASAPAQPATQATAPAQPAIQATAPAQAQATAAPVMSSDTCRTCHTKPEYTIVSVNSGRSDIQKQLETDRSYAHRFIECATCHGGNPHAQMTPITKTSIAEACGQCHTSQLTAHVNSIHGESLSSGGKDAASCVDCHSTKDSPHAITRVLSPESSSYRASIAATCAKCHAREDVMERYGVPTEVYKTYMHTFHGKANVLSPYEITQHPKATCINCHGYHDIKDERHPESPVNPVNLPATCGSCHPGAGEKFAASWMGHKEASPEQFPVVYFAERFFFFLTTTVLAFGFIFMVALELGSWIVRRRGSGH
jgi:hypothetical protein